MAPAAPPATKRSAAVAVAGSLATAPLRASKAMNLIAVSGAILSTFAALPRQKAARPPSCWMARTTAMPPPPPPPLGATCIIVLMRSIGAVAVRLTAPATPPAQSLASRAWMRLCSAAVRSGGGVQAPSACSMCAVSWKA